MLFLDDAASAGTSAGIDAVDGVLLVLIVVIAALIVLLAIVSGIVSIWLWVRYRKFNHKENTCGLTGDEVARKILDENGLTNIKVKCVGSVLFGNSYGHYFKVVRLRRLIHAKKTVTSLAMASEKSALAVLDKEQDPDMVKRVKLVPLIDFGPLLCVPMFLVGVLLDVILFNGTGVSTIIFSAIGILFYVFAFVLSVLELKTEKKAQERAYKILKEDNLATEEELADLKELFKLYNIEYINNMVIALLELIYRILLIILQAKNGSSSSDD